MLRAQYFQSTEKMPGRGTLLIANVVQPQLVENEKEKTIKHHATIHVKYCKHLCSATFIQLGLVWLGQNPSSDIDICTKNCTERCTQNVESQ